MEVSLWKFRKLILLIIGGLAILVLIGTVGVELFTPKEVSADATSTVGVTATVESWLTFQVSTTSVSLTPALVDSTGATHIGSSTAITLTLGTNNTNGWSITIQGANGGLYSNTASHLISTVSGTSTLSAGTDGYGANATATYSGVTIGNYYDYWGTDTVGEIASSTSYTLASRDSPNAEADVADMKIKAAAQATTPAANDYSDTITLTAIPST